MVFAAFEALLAPKSCWDPSASAWCAWPQTSARLIALRRAIYPDARGSEAAISELNCTRVPGAQRTGSAGGFLLVRGERRSGTRGAIFHKEPFHLPSRRTRSGEHAAAVRQERHNAHRRLPPRRARPKSPSPTNERPIHRAEEHVVASHATRALMLTFADKALLLRWLKCSHLLTSYRRATGSRPCRSASAMHPLWARSRPRRVCGHAVVSFSRFTGFRHRMQPRSVPPRSLRRLASQITSDPWSYALVS